MPMNEFMSEAIDGAKIGLMIAGGLFVTILVFGAVVFVFYTFVKHLRGPR
jgi:hypothetical protein